MENTVLGIILTENTCATSKPKNVLLSKKPQTTPAFSRKGILTGHIPQAQR